MTPTTLSAVRGWLDAPAAASLARMDAARGRPLRTNSTGRTRREQQEAYEKYLNGGSFAAKPGSSPHEYGNAVDFHITEWAWLLEHGQAYGWYLTIKSEPWHRVYYASRDTRPSNQPTGIEEDEMTREQADEALALLRGMNAKLDDMATSIVLIGGINEKIDASVLPTLTALREQLNALA